MIYTNLTKKAMILAYNAHHGQTDRGGVPYIFHPFHLAEQMTDEYTTCAALLHDVVEDTNVTIDELSKHFPKEVIDAVVLLTHEADVPYLEYVEKIKRNPIARTVKLADLHHNCDPTRLPNGAMDEGVIRRYENKYKKALEVLE